MSSNFNNLEQLITDEMNNQNSNENNDNDNNENNDNNNQFNQNNSINNQNKNSSPLINNQLNNDEDSENEKDSSWYVQVYEDKIKKLKTELNYKNKENQSLKNDNENLINQLKLQKQSFDEYRKNLEKAKKEKENE